MFNLHIQNPTLKQVLRQLLVTAYGDNGLITNDEAPIIITDKLDLAGKERPSDKVIILLIESNDLMMQSSEGVIHLSLPLKPTAFIQKCRDVIKKATVPDLNKTIKIQGFNFNPSEFLLVSESDGAETMLTEKERNILILLHEAQNKAVSRDAMLGKIWNYTTDLETHTLETHIYRLRQKIEKDPSAPKILLTEDKGYRLLT